MFLHKIYGFTGREQGNSKVPGEQNEKGKNMIEQRETAKAQSQGFSNWDDRRPKHLLLPLKKEIE